MASKRIIWTPQERDTIAKNIARNLLASKKSPDLKNIRYQLLHGITGIRASRYRKAFSPEEVVAFQTSIKAHLNARLLDEPKKVVSDNPNPENDATYFVPATGEDMTINQMIAKLEEWRPSVTPALAPTHLTINIPSDAKVVINRHATPEPKKIKKSKKLFGVKVAVAGVKDKEFKRIEEEFPDTVIERINYRESPSVLKQKTRGRRIYVLAPCLNDEVKQIINDHAASVHRRFSIEALISDMNSIDEE